MNFFIYGFEKNAVALGAFKGLASGLFGVSELNAEHIARRAGTGIRRALVPAGAAGTAAAVVKNKDDKDKEQKTAEELIVGGKADGKPSSDFPADQIAKGKKVEREHTNDPAMAEEIAKDHLTEDKKYYTHLQEMEDKYVKKAFIIGFEGRFV